MKIDGEYLNNLPHELQQMLQDLADESKNQGLKMNKTKVMTENDTPIYVNNTQIVKVESCFYMGQIYSSRDKHSLIFSAGFVALDMRQKVQTS